MLVSMRLSRPAAIALRRAGSKVICGQTLLTRARIIAGAPSFQNNLQIRCFNKKIKSEKVNSSENLLEKQIAHLSSDIHHKNRIYKNDLLRVIENIKTNNFSTPWQGLLLLQCCVDMLPDESPASKLILIEEVWNALKGHTKFTTDHYNELLRCYIANGRSINAANFISQMAPVKPEESTYELILEALCERGDLNQAAEVLSNMKAAGVPATEKTFNSLIIGQGRSGNLGNIEEVLTMMKTLRVKVTKHTHATIAKAHLINKDVAGALQTIEIASSTGVIFDETHIMELVKCAALSDLNDAIPKLLQYLPEKTLENPSISPYMQSVCTQLVYSNCPLAALEVYKCLPVPAFGPNDDIGLHGRSLVRDCVKASMPSSIICIITQELVSSGRNPIALQSACLAALQMGRVPLALDLITRMKQNDIPVRPHYFWPILVVNSKSYGEKGILNTLSTMMMLELKPDYETLLDFVLPFVSFGSPQNLMKKLLDTGLVVSDVLTPMMHVLLSSGQIQAASELSELFEGKIDSEKLIEPLMKGFLMNEDVQSTIYVLEEITAKAMRKHNDWAGRFLCKLVGNNKIKHDRSSFAELVKGMKMGGLKISSSAYELCVSTLSSQRGSNGDELEILKGDLDSITDHGLFDEAEVFLQHIPHPRTMSTTELRCHVTELEAQGMNTRGALRKLLQQYCREGELQAAKEIADKCRAEGVFLSAGMKASIFDMYVKLGEMDMAEETLSDLIKTFPNFVLDEHKLIDFGTLLVYRNKINKAFDLIEKLSQKRRIIGGKNLEQNCWRLLDAMASAGTAKQTQNMYNLLAQNRYCKPSNVVLGPLVRVHLKNDDLAAAVSEFSRIANTHRCTPLKHELLCKVLVRAGPHADAAADEAPQHTSAAAQRDHKLLASVLEASRRVHGAADSQLSLIAALAELGHKSALRRQLMDTKSRVDSAALHKRCQRFADENKLTPIENIFECSRGVRSIEREALYEIMLQVHQRNDDCQGAISLWYKMAEEDLRPSHKFAMNLTSLLRANNKSIPPEIIAVLDKKTRSEIM